MIISRENKKDAEVKAVSNCIAEFNDNPEKLAAFITDLDQEKHRSWSDYKKEYGKAIALIYKGRSFPSKKIKGSSGRLPFGQVFGLTNNAPQLIPTINFSRCKTKVEKVKLILKQYISVELKKEMVEFILSQH